MVGGERDGTHAQLVAVPEGCAVPLPDGLDFQSAAGLSLAGLTAWNMVVEAGRVQQGETALVLGASGGVGVFTVMLLKKLGLTVHAVTSSPDKRARLLSLGADTVLNDRTADVLKFTRQLPNKGVDVAFNCVGGSTWRYVLASVRTGGRIIVCGTVRAPSAELDMRQVFYRSLSIVGCSMGTPAALSRVLELAASDSAFRAPIADVITLEGLPDAHRRMEAGAITGKIIVQMES
jgi:NADPH:quinone reductase-like Zn-dependent oxidoreductase